MDENWRPVSKRFFDAMRKHGVKSSSPDFVNFPFSNSCESCCGVDGKFKPYKFTFQHACKLIEKNGKVSWSDMEEIDFREPAAYERMKTGWNGGGGVFNLNDSPEIKVLDYETVEGKRYAIYGKNKKAAKGKKRGLFT